MSVRFVYFDCMETLVQMDIPSMEVYPHWAFEAGESLGLWDSYLTFRDGWVNERKRVKADLGALREGRLADRVRCLIEAAVELRDESWGEERIAAAVAGVISGYWQRYLDASYLTAGLLETLRWLRDERGVGLGVVSNFIVPGGIGELLARHELHEFFNPVIVSCNLGWKKPAERIYEAAALQAGVSPAEILFVGDNKLADYDGPRLCGMRSLLFDPQGEWPEVDERIAAMAELRDHV